MCVTDIPRIVKMWEFTKEDGTIDFEKGYEFCKEHPYNRVLNFNLPKEEVDDWARRFYEGVRKYKQEHEDNIQQNNSFWKRLLRH